MIVGLGAVVIEGTKSALARPVVFVSTLMIVAITAGALVLTAGRAQAINDDIIAGLDAASSRAVIVEFGEEALVTLDVVERLKGLEEIEWSAAFGSTDDVTNGAIEGGSSVAARQIMGDRLGEALLIGTSKSVPEVAIAGREALEALGVGSEGGYIAKRSGETVPLVGRAELPSYLQDMEQVVFLRNVDSGKEAAVRLVVVAKSHSDVPSLASLLPGLVGAADLRFVSVSSSADLEQLREVVGGSLAESADTAVAVVLAVGASVSAVLVMGGVLLRRRDFGRRRALGASKQMVASLVVIETVTAAVPGSLSGISVANIYLIATSSPLPSLDFDVASALLAVAVSAVASMVPAVLAALRDPIEELRVA